MFLILQRAKLLRPSTYLVNWFNAGRGFSGPRDISGVESVQILKGPKAALFGRGEPGGTINLVTKRPTFETAGDVKLTAGSFDFYRADADFQTALNDKVAVRVSGFYEDAESFRDEVETERWGIYPSIAFHPSEVIPTTRQLLVPCATMSSNILIFEARVAFIGRRRR